MTLVETLRLITAASGEAQLAAAAVFGLLKAARALWPDNEEPKPSDRTLVGIMREVFTQNDVQRVEYIAELEALEAELPAEG